MLDRRLFAKTAAVLPIAGLPIADVAAQANAAEPPLISRTAYKFLFENCADWLAFMDRAPDPAWRSPRMQELVTERVFARYAGQSAVRSERIAPDTKIMLVHEAKDERRSFTSRAT